MILISVEEYESMQETIEVLSNQNLFNDIHVALKEHEEDKSLDLEEFWRKKMSETYNITQSSSPA